MGLIGSDIFPLAAHVAHFRPSAPATRKIALAQTTRGHALIDLISIAPFYIELIIGGNESGLAVVRMLRMSRIFRCASICELY